MDWTTWLYLPALLTLASLSLLAIYSRHFQDNLLQRIGLCGVCFGAVLRIATLATGSDVPGPCLVLIHGAAAFAVGVAYKFWRCKA